MRALDILNTIDSDSRLLEYVRVHPKIDDMADEILDLQKTYSDLHIRLETRRMHNEDIQSILGHMSKARQMLKLRATSYDVMANFPYISRDMFDLGHISSMRIGAEDVLVQLPVFSLYAHDIDQRLSDDKMPEWKRPLRLGSNPTAYPIECSSQKPPSMLEGRGGKPSIPEGLERLITSPIKILSDIAQYDFGIYTVTSILIDEQSRSKVRDAQKHFENRIYYLVDRTGKRDIISNPIAIGYHLGDVFFITNIPNETEFQT
jgi:hypothetical protein